MKYIQFSLLLFVLLMAATFSQASNFLPSVDLLGASGKQVIKAVVSSGERKNMNISRIDEDQVVMEKRISDDVATSLFFGSSYDRTPSLRLKYLLKKTGLGIRLTLRTFIVTNPGSAQEQASDASSFDEFIKPAKLALSEIKASLSPASDTVMEIASVAPKPVTTPSQVKIEGEMVDVVRATQSFNASKIAGAINCSRDVIFISVKEGIETFKTICNSGEAVFISCWHRQCVAL